MTPFASGICATAKPAPIPAMPSPIATRTISLRENLRLFILPLVSPPRNTAGLGARPRNHWDMVSQRVQDRGLYSVQAAASREPLHRLSGDAADLVEVMVVMKDDGIVEFGERRDQQFDRLRSQMLATHR